MSVPAGTIVLATRSPGKLRELRPIFDAAGVAVIALDEAGVEESPAEAELEVHDSFEENAVAKARYFHALCRAPVVADDSGLAVDALGGAPGVRSKRWSGRTDLEGQPLDDANNARLLAALDGVRDRRARYVCVAAYCDGVRELLSRGEVEGRILTEAHGTAGFGYDPYFYSEEIGRSFGASSRSEKERVSHRGRAFRALIARLPMAQLRVQR